MRKKSHLLLSHKRMNRYQLDVGLCKHKKIVGGDYSVFLAYEARNLNILGLNSRVKWEKLTSVCDHFHLNLNTRTLNNRANDDSLLHDSTAW